MHYERKFNQQLLQLSKSHPALVLTGARQSGKTTLLQRVFPNHQYVSLDLPSVAELAERNPETFFLQHAPPLIVDEVQYAPGLFRHLKQLIDKDRLTSGQFMLTGSQKFNLMKNVSESLAGRCVWVELENLPYEEIAAHNKPDTDLLLRVLARGQFPELWRVPDISANDYYRSYLATYLERDVRQLINVTSLRDYERFIRLLAVRSGQGFNRSELARETGVSVKTISDWASALEASNQIVFLEPWYHNFSKRIVKNPKIYFCDTGFLCYLLNIHPSQLLASPFLGSLWETFVFAELRKINRTLAEPYQLWFYRDQRAREIDFVLERGGVLSFLECKWTERPREEDTLTMHKIAEELKESSTPFRPGWMGVVCRTANAYPMQAGERALALSDLRQQLE
ncbi:MAG: hypothetical protein A2X46_16010 [Lentisphaerae bacterium GWF2_57_35]|nr:MAG: hypothetical protein A2X46_16010 [Lentisphaerae bacterium GWF2_57_35]